MGITYGVILFIFCGVLGAWSVYLLTWLYAEYKTRSSLERKFPQGHVLQVCEGPVNGMMPLKYNNKFIGVILLRVISVRLIIAKHNFISDRPKTIRNPVIGSTLKQQDFSFT